MTRFQAGAGTVALEATRALGSAGYEHTIFAGQGNHLLDEARAAGCHVVLVPSLHPEIKPAADLRTLGLLTTLLRDGSFDVVHTHSSKSGALGRLAARRAGVDRVVHTFHGFPFHEFQSRWRRGAYIAAERRLGQLTDVFLCVGTTVAAEAVRRHIAPPEKVRSIGVAVSLPKMAPPTARNRARFALGLPATARVVGTVGRLDYQKAPEDFIRALAQSSFSDVIGVWIGDGPLRRQAERWSARYGVSARMLFVGERRDVPELLPALDVFAMSSIYEGLPCALVEAIAQNIPVVATAVNAVPDVVVPGVTGLLVPPRDPTSLARAIDHVFREPDRARRQADAARRALGTRFSPETLAAVLHEVYSDGWTIESNGQRAEVQHRRAR
jgi:glycosyltransferase involved in cell wall biosynthesis